MTLARRRFLFMAPAIVAAPSLMKLSARAGFQLIPRLTSHTAWFLQDDPPLQFIEPRQLIVPPNLEVDAKRLILSFDRFRDIVEPVLREYFAMEYNDLSLTKGNPQDGSDDRFDRRLVQAHRRAPGQGDR